jgi:hypothetical protein
VLRTPFSLRATVALDNPASGHHGGEHDRRAGGHRASAGHRPGQLAGGAAILVTGEHGPVPLLEVFEGRTFFNGLVSERSHLHSRDVTFATFCQGPYQESIAYFMGWRMLWYSARDSAGA